VQVAGQALQGGAVGDVIRVRNLGSGKSLLARIESATAVAVVGLAR
jgi:flagella basal body P-ring formation protein FlgA